MYENNRYQPNLQQSIHKPHSVSYSPNIQPTANTPYLYSSGALDPKKVNSPNLNIHTRN